MAIRLSPIARVGTLALAAALTGPALWPLPASATSLKPLVVQASDVASAYGSGFKALSSRPMRASDLNGMATSAAGGSTALMKGFVSGYFSSFYRPSTAHSGKSISSKPGVSIVTNGVSLYSNAAYPRAALELTMKNKASILKALHKEHVTNAHIGWFGGVGEKAIMMTYSLTMPAFTPGTKPSKTLAVLYLFIRGKYTATLSVSGSSAISQDQALAIAKRVDSRIQHAG